MDFIYEYELCALIFLCLVALRFFTRRYFSVMQYRVFAVIIVAAMIVLLLDSITCYTIQYSSVIPNWLNYLLCLPMFFSLILLPAMFYLYVMILTRQISFGHYKFMLVRMFPFVLEELFLLSTPWTHLIFSFNAQHTYLHGVGYRFLYFCAFLYIFFAAITAVYDRAAMKKEQFHTILVVVVLLTAGIGLQYLFPRLLVAGVAMALSILMMYQTMQNPDDLLDTMTGLLDRQGFLLILQDRIDAGSKFQLIIISLDEMKITNNLVGLKNGDRLLQEIAGFLKAFSAKQQVFRIDGDVFAFITEKEEDCLQIVGVIAQRFTNLWPIGNLELKQAATVCYALQPHGESTAQILQTLEFALQQTKRAGKNKVFAITDAMSADIQRQLAIESALRRAIELDTLEVFYQPIYSLQQQRFVSAEALVRLFDPVLGSIAPDEFIPIAEKNGLVVRIDEMILKKVCSFIARYQPDCLGLDGVELNMSIVDFMQQNLVSKVSKIIAEYRINPALLHFEVTESIASASETMIAERMGEMVELGVKFSLDDYGTGYANLARLMHLPFSTVKLDKSLLWDAFTNEKNQIILTVTVDMIQSLGYDLIVEGVENSEHLIKLQCIGADKVQGFFFSKPVTEKELVSFLANDQYNQVKIKELQDLNVSK